MMTESKKDRFYTLMIVPHDARGKPISLKIPAKWVYTAASVAVFSFILVASSMLYSTILSRRLLHYADTLSKNRQQKELISSFSNRNQKVSRAIDELAQKDNELRKLLGLRGWKSKVKLNTINNVSFDLRLAERQESLQELKDWVNLVRSRFASTPSTWPIYGRLVSFFGYRTYPWRGLHTGIDIQSYRGAPVRAAAGGIVSFVGWRNGYGKTVEISHGYGVATLYAHNSNYAVRAGQRVRKNQVICFVGTTGWTTGPHLHYEVRRWDRPINPVAYLNLNILSASRLWR